MFGDQTPSKIAFIKHANVEVSNLTVKICLIKHRWNNWYKPLVWYCLIVFVRVCSCLIVFDRIWSCLIKYEGHQMFDQKRNTFILFACLMGDVLFVWTAAYQTCLMRACVPRLLSGSYQLFDLCLIKHVLTVWPLTSTLACLATKQCLMVFGHQTIFDGVWSPNIFNPFFNLVIKLLL